MSFEGCGIQSINSALKKQSNQWSDELAKINKQVLERQKREEDKITATIETAKNTAEIKEDLKDVIHNQNSYIRLLEKQIKCLMEQTEQLNNIFASGEDSVLVQKELLKIMSDNEIDIKQLAVDKGADAVLTAVFSSLPLALKAMGYM